MESRCIEYGHSMIKNGRDEFWLCYSIVVTEILGARGVPLCESYGIRIDMDSTRRGRRETDTVYDISLSFTRINEIAATLCRNQVTPVALRDVIEDLQCDNRRVAGCW